MSVSCRRSLWRQDLWILQNSDDLERSMKHRSPLILRKIKAGVIFSVCSSHPISQGWASLHNLHSHRTVWGWCGRNHIIPDSILISTTPVSLKTLWRVKGAHKYLIQATGILPTVLCYILQPSGNFYPGIFRRRLVHSLDFTFRVFKYFITKILHLIRFYAVFQLFIFKFSDY